MRPYGSLWVFISLYAFSCVFIGFDTSLCVLMGRYMFYKSICVLMDFNGSLLVLIGPYSLLWILMGPNGSF